jgi:two-component system phosphate regulon sensor histidine kinase PhoR
MCEKKAADKDVSIQLECRGDVTALMNGPLLEQAVVNLVDNAIKYTESGGSVVVSAADDPHGVAIRVQDRGCGIEPKHLPRLFERFYRADKARSRALGGTGLGLAIVKHIALTHRGEVDVESRVGVGSTFTIRLPDPSTQSRIPAESEGLSAAV